MLASILARIAESAIPIRLIGLAGAGLAIAAAVTYHAVTVFRLERDLSQAKADHAAALADVARRDTAIVDLERSIASQNAAVGRLQADGQARSHRAATAARQELARPAGPMPADVAALNRWIRRPSGGDAE